MLGVPEKGVLRYRQFRAVTRISSPTFMFSVWNSWLFPETIDDVPLAHSSFQPFDIPDEIWTHIFEEPSLLQRDLYPVFTSCHHFNGLVLPILLYSFSATKPSDLAIGDVYIPSDMLPIFSSLAFRLPFIRRLTAIFDIRNRGGAPVLRELQALKTLVGRTSSLVDLRLNFPGDLLSPQPAGLAQRLTESFCDLLSSYPYNPDDPVVSVDTEVFSCRAVDIRRWQLDKYRFTDADTGLGGGLYGLLSGIHTFIRPPSTTKHPHRTKTSIQLHNGLHSAVFPFISITSAHIQRLHGPPSAGFPSWTLVVLNSSLHHWPNAVNLAAPLAAAEWAAILPLLKFEVLPQVRMDPPEGDPARANIPTVSNIPARVLDAFLDRHPTITRMYYYPDPHTLPDAPPFPSASLPRMRNITTTARSVLHLFHDPAHAFPNLFVIRINGVDDAQVMTDALRLLARHGGGNKLILEVSSGSWMDNSLDDGAAVIRSLHRVDTVILSGFTDFVEPSAILRWVSLFPALRRVGLQGCVHPDAGPKEQKGFPHLAREALPNSLELIST